MFAAVEVEIGETNTFPAEVRSPGGVEFGFVDVTVTMPSRVICEEDAPYDIEVEYQFYGFTTYNYEISELGTGDCGLSSSFISPYLQTIETAIRTNTVACPFGGANIRMNLLGVPFDRNTLVSVQVVWEDCPELESPPP